MAVTRTDDIDDLELDSILADVLARTDERNLLGGARTKVTADFATNVNEQISSLQNNLLGGLAAVILVALLLISWRAALVIALFIPTVLAATFAGLDLLGLTLNTVTLFAAILTLGLFVDDATIVVEAIDTHRRDRSRQKKIITSAVNRIGVATVAGTLTTVLVFTPMLMVTGILGDFIRLLPITVIVALFVSLAVSIVIVPFLSRWLVLGSQRSSFLDRLKLLAPVEKKLGLWVSNLPSLILVKRRRGRLVRLIMIELSVLAVIGAGIFAAQLPFEIFPKTKDTNYLRSTVQFAPNTSIAEAQAITDTIDERISNTVGQELTYITYLQANERSAVIEIGLSSYKVRSQTSGQLVEKLVSTGTGLDGATIKYSQLDAGPPSEDFPFQMRVFAEQDQLLPLSSAVARFVQDAEFDEASVVEVRVNQAGTINRANHGRYVDIIARFNSDESVSSNVIQLENQVKREFNDDRLAEYDANEQSFDFEISQENDNAESFTSMGQGIVVALVAMYILLVLLFDSFLQPMLILLAVPFGLFGVFFGLAITNNSLSFFSVLGIMGLIGIAVNNSIMLTEYANQERKNGSTRHQAITNALRDRFRALIATTATTVVALLPLALSDPFWQPLAVTIIFGIVSSTVLIILSFPYYYLGLERLRDWAHYRIKLH